MSVMYATPAELASWLKKDVDTATATLALQTASALFSARAATQFVPTPTTYEVIAQGFWQLRLPFRPIISIDQVRINSFAGGVRVITDYKRIRSVLYRAAGFGAPGTFPPDSAEIDLHWGLDACPDDVKGAVLETAGVGYQHPDVTVVAEVIDDYSFRSAPNSGGMMLTPAAAALADLYRGTYAA